MSAAAPPLHLASLQLVDDVWMDAIDHSNTGVIDATMMLAALGRGGRLSEARPSKHSPHSAPRVRRARRKT